MEWPAKLNCVSGLTACILANVLGRHEWQVEDHPGTCRGETTTSKSRKCSDDLKASRLKTVASKANDTWERHVAKL